jgi:hypothetical protein
MATSPLQINKPCHENWGAMTPNERGRHCASCNKTVVDLTAMPVSQAAAFMNDLGDRLRSKPDQHVCVRAHADTSGRLMKPGARRLLRPEGLAAILAMSLSGCGQNASTTQHLTPPPTPVNASTDPQPLLGEISCPTPTPREMMGDVIVQPLQDPDSQPIMGKPVATPVQPMMGLIVPPEATPAQPPVIKGEVEAVPQNQ